MSEPERSNTPPSDDEDELERKLAEKEKLLKSEKKALLQARIEATIRQTAELTQAKESELNAAKEKEKKHEEEKIAKAGTKRKTEEETKDNPVTEARLKKLIAEAQMSGGNFSHTFANPTSRMAANFAKEIMALANNVEDGEQIMTKAKGFYYKLVLMADNPSADKMFESFEAQAELTGTPVASIIQANAPFLAQSSLQAKKPRFNVRPYQSQRYGYSGSGNNYRICNGYGHFAASCPSAFGSQQRRRLPHIPGLNELK